MKGLRLAIASSAALLVSTAAVLSVHAATTAALPAPRAATHSAATPIVPNGAWTVYHHDNAHTGFDSTQPTASTATAGWTSAPLDDSIYAEPLVYGGIVYAVTLNNTVYALNQSDGSLVWSTPIRAPVTSGWTCGNVDRMGILGTPVIAGGRIYVVTLAGADHLYRVEGLNLTTGVSEFSVALPTAGFDWHIQQQRGALGFANGYVYVPFGGRAGDCGPYHGWIYGVPIAGGTVNTYATPGQGAGFWTPGGVVIDDSTGKVFDTSGNGTASGCDANPDGTPVFENDAVVRLSSTLAHEEAFIPLDWQANWCGNDEDLGSASMVLISPTLAFQTGKWGNGFLVNPKSLGGMDGQLYPTPKPAAYSPVDVCFGSHHDANFGSYAYAAPYVYLSCDHNTRDSIRGGLVGLKLDTATPSFSSCDSTCGAPSWHSGDTSFGPPIVAGGAVWVVDQAGTGLYGFNATTGAEIFHSTGFAATHFTTPSEAGGQIFVATGNEVREFNIVAGCKGVALSATPPSQSATGASVLLSASGVVGCTTPMYRFWVQPPGGGWGIVRDYSASSTFSWNGTGIAGLYHLEVDARDASSSASYDSTANIPYTLNGCTGAAISAAPPSPQQPGGTVVITGTATCPGTATYKFWTKAPGAPWVTAQDYSTSSTYNWRTTGLALGTYGLEVDARNQSGTDTYETTSSTNYVLSVGTCGKPMLSANPASPGATGASITFSSTTSGCPNPRFRFWVQAPGGMWTIRQDYSALNTFNWTGTGLAGAYGVEVDVRDQAEGSSVSYDAVNNITYQLNGCSAVSLGTNPASPHYPSGSVLLTGTATCPGTATYRFWVQAPGGPWTIKQDYSTTNTFSWSIAGLPLGSYGLEVDVRNQGGTDTYEKVNSLTFVLQATPCSTPTLTANPTSPGATGGSFTFTATTTGCTVPVYRFWLLRTGFNWGIVRSYSTSNTFLWQQPATAQPGSYGIEVDVRDAAETTSYDAVKNITYVLNGCSAVSLSASPANTAPRGSTVTLTATSTCPGPPFYRFWIKTPGGTWTIVQDYGSPSTFSWTSSSTPINTSLPGNYSIEIDVRNQGSLETWEKVNTITFVLT